MAEDWPPDYVAIFARRQKWLTAMRAEPDKLPKIHAYYSTHPVEWIEDWCTTYDPRNAAAPGKLTNMPFVLFKRQREFVEFLHLCVTHQADGLVEKCRDMGATWLCCAYSVWTWRYWPGAAVGWGSRNQDLVDKLGVPDSIFEKMRILIRGLPKEFLPAGFIEDKHLSSMRFLNPENRATITGEIGDNIGRGGRKLFYIKDESAWYERPEGIEASLGDNTRCQIDISSVHGLGNVFHRKREAGIEWAPGQDLVHTAVNVFIFDWSDHPEKTREWYFERRAKAEASGMLHVFAQEVERDYSASVAGTIIPAAWIKAAIDAHVTLKFADNGNWSAGLDVADNDSVNGDRNAMSIRKGSILTAVHEWGERDTGVTARKAVGFVRSLGFIQVQYDCIGVGSGVKAEINRLRDDRIMPQGVRFIAWNAAAAPLNPEARVDPHDKDTPLNKDFYYNLKAQGWWQLRRRFEKTFMAVTQGAIYPHDELISLPSTLPNLRQIEKELSQPTSSSNTRLKMVVNKTPSGSKSPNLADAIMMNFWPVPAPTTARRSLVAHMGR